MGMASVFYDTGYLLFHLLAPSHIVQGNGTNVFKYRRIALGVYGGLRPPHNPVSCEKEPLL